MQKQKIFIGLDGDSIGRVIEQSLILNDVSALKEFSALVVEALEKIKESAMREGGEIVFCTGDSILIHGYFEIEFAQFALETFAAITKRTASVGVGLDTATTYLGLKLAKSKGGNQVCFFELNKITK